MKLYNLLILIQLQLANVTRLSKLQSIHYTTMLNVDIYFL